MALVRWEPSREVYGFRDHVNRMLADAFRGLGNPADAESTMGAWGPPVDIYEKDGHLVLDVELPGVDVKDIDVRVENNTLTLSGERRRDDEIKDDNLHRVERCYGSFTRSFSLPSTVDRDKIKAEYNNGVLKLALPKKEEAKPRQISIAVTH